MPTPFKVNITIEHGQLHDSLDSEVDRQEMINRLQDILLGKTGDTELREGVIQILIDQLRLDNGHEPLFVNQDEEIEWVSKIVERREGHAQEGELRPIDVKIDKYRHTEKTKQKDKNKPGNPFNLKNNPGQRVSSGPYTDKAHSIDQKFYKFSIEAEDGLGHKLKLDPCIICPR